MSALLVEHVEQVQGCPPMYGYHTRQLDTSEYLDYWGDRISNSSFVQWVLSNEDLSGENATSLRPASDVTVHGVLTVFLLNSGVFAACILAYEILRRVMPAVYVGSHSNDLRRAVSLDPLLDMPFPFWVLGVVRIPWIKVRENAGLDAYMFLRYIRMCLRITTVSSFWGMVILGPIYATGNAGAQGWYHLSMSNVGQSSWRTWVACIFLWLTTLYVLWVILEEYKHYLDLRTDFLGRGELSKRQVNPQHHYSIKVERIPKELRSDKALFDYFEGLFPGKVHSACMVLNLPELEGLKSKRLRVCRRLEKSLAYLEATGRRSTHVVGQPRLMCLGIESELIRARYCSCCLKKRRMWNEYCDRAPERGDQVDSISYYTLELADMNEQMEALQKKKVSLAEKGNHEVLASNWIDRVVTAASTVAASVVSGAAEGEEEDEYSQDKVSIEEKSAKEESRRRYGSLGETSCEGCIKDSMTTTISSYSTGERRVIFPSHANRRPSSPQKYEGLDDGFHSFRLIEDDFLDDAIFFDADPTDPSMENENRGSFRKILGMLGLDFAKVACSRISNDIGLYVDNVFGTTISSTGFVTFHDLTSVSSAASAPLTNTPDVLDAAVAPEPRDIIWSNAHIDTQMSAGRERTANILLALGAILWSVPLVLIQAFATADSLARIPGMSWIVEHGGQFTSFINGYLPVVALLGLILLLPIIFEWVGENFENRKTYSDVQHSIVGRYFYYQLANIYISVTAGSLWDSLYDIIDQPSQIFDILGKSLPTVVGYFISLLITKILAGLPMVLLRFGPLGKMLFYRLCFNEDKLTQRELDEVYKKQSLWYGWEYPTQLLVIVICFTYAAISPIILPFGAVYFLGAMIVYKKQVLYVYTPTYESGGVLFPSACDRTLLGLITGQLTFIGYCLLKEAQYQPLFLFPLPFMTFYMMTKYRRMYGKPGMRLSLERARDVDSSSPKASKNFDKDAYRQPVLAEKAAGPLPYRRRPKKNVASRILVIPSSSSSGRDSVSRLVGNVKRIRLGQRETSVEPASVVSNAYVK